MSADDGLDDDFVIIFDDNESQKDLEIVFDTSKPKKAPEIEIVIDERPTVKVQTKKWKRFEQIGEFMWQCPICFEENEDYRLLCTHCTFNKGQAYYLGEEKGYKIWDDGTYRYTMDGQELAFKQISTRQNETFSKKKEELRSE